MAASLSAALIQFALSAHAAQEVPLNGIVSAQNLIEKASPGDSLLISPDTNHKSGLWITDSELSTLSGGFGAVNFAASGGVIQVGGSAFGTKASGGRGGYLKVGSIGSSGATPAIILLGSQTNPTLFKAGEVKVSDFHASSDAAALTFSLDKLEVQSSAFDAGYVMDHGTKGTIERSLSVNSGKNGKFLISDRSELKVGSPLAAQDSITLENHQGLADGFLDGAISGNAIVNSKVTAPLIFLEGNQSGKTSLQIVGSQINAGIIAMHAHPEDSQGPNTLDLVLGHGSEINTEQIRIAASPTLQNNLYLGDRLGAPKLNLSDAQQFTHEAGRILIEAAEGSSTTKIVLNNNYTYERGEDGYLFDARVRVKGEGYPESQHNLVVRNESGFSTYASLAESVDADNLISLEVVGGTLRYEGSRPATISHVHVTGSGVFVLENYMHVWDVAIHGDENGTVIYDSGSLGELNVGLNYGSELSTFKGKSIVRGGSLSIWESDVLGTPKEIHVEKASKLHIWDVSQTAGSIFVEENGQLDLEESSVLTLKNGGEIRGDNGLKGGGVLNLNSGVFTVRGSNPEYRAQTTIDSPASALADSASAFGSSEIHNAGNLTFAIRGDEELKNPVFGDGLFAKAGAGRLSIVEGRALWTGPTLVAAGEMVLGSKDKPLNLLSREVSVAPGAQLSGFGRIAGSLNNQGVFVVSNSSAEPSVFEIGKDLHNTGEVRFGDNAEAVGNTLKVNGNYTGGGSVYFNTFLAGDDSVTDRLIVAGSTSGLTNVFIRNTGGEGEKTENGIELITVQGQSDGRFVLGQKVSAGIYDYYLSRGAGENSRNWYLRSDAVMPETSAVIANSIASQTMFINRLHDRLGETQYIDAFTGEVRTTSLWLRQEGSYSSWKDSSGQNKTRTLQFTAQLGGDVAQWTSDGGNRVHLGLMAGFGHSRSKVSSSVTGNKALGKTDGYSLGVYATWYANHASHEGLYADGWVTYNWFKNKLSGDKFSKVSSDSRGLTGSLELGYTQKLIDFGSSQNPLIWYVQPQAQVIWMGVKSDKVNAPGGSFKAEGHGNVRTRLGVRTFINNGGYRTNSGNQLFVEANWIHDTKAFGVEREGEKVKQKGARNTAEIKIGTETQLNKNLHLWVNAATRAGASHYRDLSANLGAKYVF